MNNAAVNIAALSEYFLGRQTEMVAAIKTLVETESPSGDEAGSKSVVSMLANTAETIAGVKVERVPVSNYGQHLRLTAFADAAEPAPLLLLGHTDTVHARGSILERPWRVEGNKAYGPGVFDMKANCVLALEVIRALTQFGIQPGRPVVLLLTCDEETGSASGRPLVEANAKQASSVLVLEPSGSGGRAKTGRKGTGIYSLAVTGRAAHAGLDPEKGASAVLELARQTERLHAFNGKSGGISVNVGVFRGGTLSNVVAAEARAEIDVRFTTAAEAELIENEIFKLRPFDDRVQLELTGGINRPPLERTEKVLKLYQQAKAIAEQLGFELGETQVGGASDGNFAAAAGAAVLDGLGIAGDGAHATHEHIILEDIPRRGVLIAALIASL
ncbi:MAG TPA: M20 family metallopeptidase [Pyrinomonadaceae bacterium]|nr:M20 family metallopeptidase [Pyrinomonadaceae bacterium]